MGGLLQIRLCFSVLERQRANSKNLSSSAFFQQWSHGEFVERRKGRSLINDTGGQDMNSAIAHTSSHILLIHFFH